MRGVSVFAAVVLAFGLGALAGCKPRKSKQKDPAPAAKETAGKEHPAPNPGGKVVVPATKSISGGGRVTGGGMTLDVQIGGSTGMPASKGGPAPKPAPAAKGAPAPKPAPAVKGAPAPKPAPATKGAAGDKK